jgi:DivIVA domain-containing protein
LPRAFDAHEEECRLVATPEPERQVLRPSSIAGRGFSLARKKGYEPEEVHEFLREVAEYVSRLQGEVEWLRARSEHLERRSAAAQEAAYARLSRDFTDVVRRADQAAGKVRLHAEAKAQSDMMMARREAERVLNQARLEAERILSTARLEAHDIDWQSKGLEARSTQGPETEWRAASELSIVDLPTVAMDIGAIWDREDAEVWPEQESDPPQLFEEAPGSEQIQDVWTANGQIAAREAPNEPKPSPQSEDLDLYLDVSILDLFDNPEA